MRSIRRILGISFLSAAALLLCASCNDFVFFNVPVNEENNPLVQKKVPRTGADLFQPPVKTGQALPDPDAGGVLADWGTCLVMLKEGHPHGGGKMHGNYVYANAPWKQEEFAVVHNTPQGVMVEIDRESTATFLEKEAGKSGPGYFRIIGGNSKLWGLCLYFFDREGKLMNDRILEHSDEYQIFFSVSDVDDRNLPYEVLDVRYRPKTETPVPAGYFKNRKSFEERRLATPEILHYTYRDTWRHDDMGDGVRELFNIRLLPPLTRKDYSSASAEDQDCVGLKGHLKFAVFNQPVDPLNDWPFKLTNGLKYHRQTVLLPQFCLAVRVMKCEKGKKTVNPASPGIGQGKNRCAPYYGPDDRSMWKEIIRFNLPMKVYASVLDSDPTAPDPYEPYYFQLGREIGLTPEEAYEAVKNIIIHGNSDSGGLGYGAWFL